LKTCGKKTRGKEEKEGLKELLRRESGEGFTRGEDLFFEVLSKRREMSSEESFPKKKGEGRG